jgi:ABC-2 type transport system permease protein
VSGVRSRLAAARSMVRIVWMGLRFRVREFTVSQWFLLMSVFQPIIFATIAFYLFQAGGRPGTLLYAALGAGMMGIWSSTLFGSGGALQWNRYQGTLELLVAAPPPFLVVLLPLTLATSVTGAYSLLATVFWGRVFFDVPLDFAHPLAFAVAVPASVLALGLMGLLMASTFILYRHANALSNLLEYPVWIATGLLFPIALLPAWVAPISWLLAPRWGVEAIRRSAEGGDPWFPIAMCVVVGALYLVLAAFALRAFERRARARATLSLT